MSHAPKLKKTLAEQILDKAGIAFDSLALNALENIELPDGIVREDIYKTLALIGDKTGPVIGVVRLTDHLSEKKLAAASGNKRTDMIPAKDLRHTTGYVHGANNPVGIWQTKKFPIYIDSIAKDQQTIIVSAGEVGRNVRIDPRVLAEFVHAAFADIRQ